MRRAFFVLWTALALVPRASPQGGEPLGPEFRINAYTSGTQRAPSVAGNSSGDFVVVWQSFLQDGSGWGVFGQRYASSGASLGPEFRVNTYTSGYQDYPDVAADPSGNFVVVWTSAYAQDGSSLGVFGQRYTSSGAPLGPEFRVNTYTTGVQSNPRAAVGPSGEFIVVWNSQNQDGSIEGVFGQRFTSSGAPLGQEFRVNTHTTSIQYLPRVAVDNVGDFIVVWWSLGQESSDSGVFGQRYASSGATLGAEFRVNTYTTGNQMFASVAKDAVGNFVVAWESYAQDGLNDGVFGQRYASSGTPVGSEFRVNSFTTSSQSFPSVASDSSGNFVVVWSDSYQDGSNGGVFGQRFASSGPALGPEFRVNTYTTSAQYLGLLSRSPRSVAAGSSGDFVVVWSSFDQDGSDGGVFGQRYGRIVPVEVMQFRVE